MITADQVLTKTNKERDAEMLNLYQDGETLEEIGLKYDLTPAGVHYVIKHNRSLIKMDNEWEKFKRVNKLNRFFKKIDENLIPKTIDESLKVIESMRKECEGEGKQILNDNRQIIYVTNYGDSSDSAEQILPASITKENRQIKSEV